MTKFLFMHGKSIIMNQCINRMVINNLIHVEGPTGRLLLFSLIENRIDAGYFNAPFQIDFWLDKHTVESLRVIMQYHLLYAI